jgi:hypothetical protein
LQSYGKEVVTGGAVVPQPLPMVLQQYAFLPIDQPACQLLKPALQSYGQGVVGGSVVAQPLPMVLQQYAFLPADQPACQLLKPALQS